VSVARTRGYGENCLEPYRLVRTSGVHGAGSPLLAAVHRCRALRILQLPMLSGAGLARVREAMPWVEQWEE
jgi:hypothetical protein